MSSDKNKHVKARLHSRNKNRERYDLTALTNSNPELSEYVITNKFGVETVDFSNPFAVKFLNKAILNHYYGISSWEFPDENLCPPIPGRADYIHHIADLLSEANHGSIPLGENITCLDIGIGASCIYPIIGVTEYGWNFIGSDIDAKSIASAQDIINSNTLLKDKVECRLQKNKRNIFRGILGRDEKIDVTICNPPFHASIEDAQRGTKRKVKNLSGKMIKNPKLNFSGRSSELIYEGGEYQFLQNMILESESVFKNCFWFTSLVSKQSNLKGIYKSLENIKPQKVITIPMDTGNKSSRIVAWTFLTEREQREWRNK
ncbi:MAG: 23S rRNA (adenine(1618)-N(6))-methyltransferase RlmF [Bacteroidetes bacterium]|nr:MAG: 23S rRNA (adenine(1618)-N(6))-methyltransferase RlmF [Bacteroidota bacterium]